MFTFDLQLFAAPTFTIAERNGATAGTLTSSVPTIAYASVDAASTTLLSGANAILAGNDSFEKWNQLYQTAIAPNSVANASFFNGAAPQDSGGSSTNIVMKYGVNGTYATPVATASSVATTACSGNTTAPGVSITTPGNTVGAVSGYVTTQALLNALTAGGNGSFPSPWLTFQYTWS
jgi:hypothetical protein